LVVSKNLLISKVCFIKERASYLAVRAGCSCEKVCSIFCSSFFICNVFVNFNRNLFNHLGVCDIINLTVLILLRFTIVPVLNRAIVACDTAINLGHLSTVRAGVMLTGDITVILTNAVCWRKGVVR